MTLGALTLAVPGRHNLLNALAAVAVGLELGLSFDRVAAGLKDFRGVERRFDVRGEPNGILVVDDYGHHPTEIAAVIAAARTLRPPDRGRLSTAPVLANLVADGRVRPGARRRPTTSCSPTSTPPARRRFRA